MKREFSGSIAKDPSNPDQNEDQFAFSVDAGRLALCDGASESFDSKTWASLLARRYAEDPCVSPDWLSETLCQYTGAHDFDSMSWSQQAAYERGSFATLLGVEHDQAHNSVDILAVGDSVAVLVSDGKMIAGWPFCDPAHFLNPPTLLATIPAHNDFLSLSGFWTQCGTTFCLDDLTDPLLLCMTDALGEWALKQLSLGGDGLNELIVIKSDDDLLALVERERAAKRMRVDDSTLIVLSFSRESIDVLPVA